jgi:NADH-quinone oxidoreductase subunit J
MVETVVFVISAAIILTGALGVIIRKHPVHAALSMIQTLFGVAVLFVAMEANFLAAVQVIVYAGAIVVLFLFVIMLVGLDRVENIKVDPITVQRPLAILAGLGIAALLGVTFFTGDSEVTGAKAQSGKPIAEAGANDVNVIAESLFSDYVFAFEATGVLLVIAVVGAVILARRPTADAIDDAMRRDAVPTGGPGKVDA